MSNTKEYRLYYISWDLEMEKVHMTSLNYCINLICHPLFENRFLSLIQPLKLHDLPS